MSVYIIQMVLLVKVYQIFVILKHNYLVTRKMIEAPY